MSTGDVSRMLASALEPFARSPDLMFVVDAERRVVARNRAAVEHAPEARDAGEHVPEASRAELMEAIRHVLATGEPRTLEWGDVGIGTVRSWYRTVVTPVDAGGGVIGAIVSSRDVVDLKRTEERLRRSEQLMVDTQGVAHLGTWEWDVTQPNATWSAELYRIYGLTPEGYTPSYEAYLTMIHPDDRQRVMDATNRVFHEHVPYSHDERIFRPDGSMRYLHTWAHPILDEAGKLVKLVGVCQDITDRKEAEVALYQLNAELEQRVSERTRQLETALRDLESFNSMVSHDLRGPLAVIQMAVEMMEQQADLPAKVPSLLVRIRRAIDNMSQLVSDLLTFARVDKSELQLADIDVSALCAELIAEQQHATPERNVAVTIETGLRMHADPTLLRAALANLIGNAWKYTARATSPRIQVGTVERPEGRVLYVQDNGIGFDMAEHDRLFRPFTRLQNAAELPGTGIGLATVARIVERHAGKIHAEAAVGQGATFFVWMPPAVWR